LDEAESTNDLSRHGGPLPMPFPLLPLPDAPSSEHLVASNRTSEFAPCATAPEPPPRRAAATAGTIAPGGKRSTAVALGQARRCPDLG
jgi:hypothetical protein